MTGFRMPVMVFLLVFLTGMGVVLGMRTGGNRKSPPSSPRPPRTKAVGRNLPPLKLPNEKSRTTGADGWEFTGEADVNFVTAKAKFTAELMHQNWRPEKQITLDASISPRVLLTLRNHDLELVLMLWKIDTNATGFAYRRETIINPGVVTQ